MPDAGPFHGTHLLRGLRRLRPQRRRQSAPAACPPGQALAKREIRARVAGTNALSRWRLQLRMAARASMRRSGLGVGTEARAGSCETGVSHNEDWRRTPKRRNRHCQSRPRSLSPRTAGEVREEATHEPGAPSRPELQQQLNVRPHPRHGGRERIVDVQRPEDKHARSTGVPDPIGDQLSRAKERHRTAGGRDDGGRDAGKKFGSWVGVARGMAHLDGGVHRPRSGERLRIARTSGSTPAGAGVQS